MKTYKNLFQKVISFENLFTAAQKAMKGKGNTLPVLKFNKKLENFLVELEDQLKNKTYMPGGYTGFYIFEPKKRYISAAPFRDRVVHHAICNSIEPIFDKTFIFDSYASRTGKGTHAAIKRVQNYLKINKYILKCDIKKYFPSIDHIVLKQEIRWRIADPELLELIDVIIDRSNEQEYVNDFFPGDDLFIPAERRKGLPLGNLTSQFFANLYLNRFDHFVKETLKVKYYTRYVDDFLLASNDIMFLRVARQKISDYLIRLRLKLHPFKTHIYRSRNGIIFLGQRIYPGYRLLKKENVRCFCRRLRKQHVQITENEISRKQFESSIGGWSGNNNKNSVVSLYYGKKPGSTAYPSSFGPSL